MKQPRSKRAIALLDALQKIFENPDATVPERLQAAELSATLLSGKKPKPAKKRKKSDVGAALREIRKLQQGETK